MGVGEGKGQLLSRRKKWFKINIYNCSIHFLSQYYLITFEIRFILASSYFLTDNKDYSLCTLYYCFNSNHCKQTDKEMRVVAVHSKLHLLQIHANLQANNIFSQHIHSIGFTQPLK